MADEVQRVRFDTNLGSFSVELYYRHAPMTCKNFAELTKRGYYNGCTFHRVISVRGGGVPTPQDFMIQGGDPSGTGRGGESIYGGPFRDEISSELHHVGAGILSMVRAPPLPR